MAQSKSPAPEAADPAAAPAEDGEVVVSGAPDEVLRLQLDRFEGPFEVLLHLIKSQEIDIFDIPIVRITEQYLAFLDLMQAENLDVAGEFLVMAATLIQIKSRMILPVETAAEEEEEIEEEDPRLELVEKLLEYRRFRDLAAALGDRGERAQDRYGRRVRFDFGAVEPEEDEADLLEIDMYDLMKAVRGIMRYVMAPQVHQVELEGSSIEEKITLIETLLERHGATSWSELRASSTRRIELICCLLAILELSRMRRIRPHQHRSYGEIRIFARQPEADHVPTPAEEAVLAEARALAEHDEAERARRDAEMRAAMEARIAEMAAAEEARKQALAEEAARQHEEAEHLAVEAAKGRKKTKKPAAEAADAGTPGDDEDEAPADDGAADEEEELDDDDGEFDDDEFDDEEDGDEEEELPEGFEWEEADDDDEDGGGEGDDAGEGGRGEEE